MSVLFQPPRNHLYESTPLTALTKAVTAVIVPPVSKAQTAGEVLWRSLYRASIYDKQAAAVAAVVSGKGMTPELATRRWLEGMSRHLKESFPEKLRSARERLSTTQQRLSEIAELSVTGLAMIERGERLPSLDTAARICWALDVAAGGTLP